MTINIKEIVDAKMDELQANKTIENTISTSLEQGIIRGVTDALESYQLRRSIDEKVSAEVSRVVASLDFTTYNGFIVDQTRKILEDVCREDLKKKIQETFEGIFICKKDSIKLSDIFKKYREIVCEEVNDADKYNRGHFHVKLEEHPTYHWLSCELHEEEPNGYSDKDIKFTVYKNRDGSGQIGCVYLDGNSIDSKIKFSHMNDVEIMLVQAVYNKIPIIIDVESEYDIDDSYDVD